MTTPMTTSEHEHRPVVDRRLERQPVDEEAEIGAEVRIGLAERLADARAQGDATRDRRRA